MYTPLYFSLFSILYIVISFATIKARKTNKVALGTGDQDEIIGYVSSHSNFAAYVPFILLGMLLIEPQSPQNPIIHVIGVLALFGRIIHYKALTASPQNFKLRVRGMQLTLIPLMVAIGANILIFAKNMIANN